MVNSGRIPPKLYGFKLASTVLGGKHISFSTIRKEVFVVIAYILGKASYISECRRMIIERLPNSNLAHALDKKPYDLISDMYGYISLILF